MNRRAFLTGTVAVAGAVVGGVVPVIGSPSQVTLPLAFDATPYRELLEGAREISDAIYRALGKPESGPENAEMIDVFIKHSNCQKNPDGCLASFRLYPSPAKERDGAAHYVLGRVHWTIKSQHTTMHCSANRRHPENFDWIGSLT